MKRCLQCLDIGGQSGEPDQQVVLQFEHSLKVGGEGGELGTDSAVASDTHAVLTRHGDNGASVIIENGHTLKY